MSFAWREIRDHLLHSASTLGFQRSFNAIRHVKEAIAPFLDPAALLDGLHHGPDDPDEKNLILAALIEAAQGEDPAAECALILLLLALWPGLDAIRHRAVWRRIGTADEIASDILSRTTGAIRVLDLGRVNRMAATILRNVERDMIRARQRESLRESMASGINPDDIPEGHAGRWNGMEGAHLQEHLHKLIGADAVLVIRVAIEGFSQGEAAMELGLTEAAARKRYQRALSGLRDALGEIS
jgi:DNA-directed RNA polymerase specialized sigma24 family protein